VRLAKNPDALRRFFVAPSVEVVPRNGALAAVAGLSDARRVVVAAEDLDGWRPPERRWLPHAVRVTSLDQGAIELSLPKGGKKLLATSLPVPQGWKVTAEGRPLRTVTVNHAFLGAVVPRGVGVVKLRFVPPGLGLGWLLCVVSLVVLASFALVPWRGVRGSVAGERPLLRSAGDSSLEE
jgi:hypothetical protein